MNDNGTRVKFAEESATRENPEGKGQPALISPFAMTRLAKWYEQGAGKYGARNWEKGLPYSNCTNSMYRHLLAWQKGDRSEDHLAAIAWNAFAIMHYQELDMGCEYDDMPRYKIKTQPMQNIKHGDTIYLIEAKLRRDGMGYDSVKMFIAEVVYAAQNSVNIKAPFDCKATLLTYVPKYSIDTDDVAISSGLTNYYLYTSLKAAEDKQIELCAKEATAGESISAQ